MGMEDCKSSAVCFNCFQSNHQANEEKFSTASYLRSFDLNCLFLDTDETGEIFVKVFKNNFNARDLNEGDIILLFKLIVQAYLKVQHDATVTTLLKQYDDSTYFQARDDICKSLQHVRNIVDAVSFESTRANCILTEVLYLLDLIRDLRYFDESFLNKCLTHKIGNKLHSASYNYLHLQFDIRYLLLTIVYKLNRSKQDSNILVENVVNNVIFDLIKFSSTMFLSMPENNQPPEKTAFVCICNKEFWLLIQLFLEKVSFQGFQNFWTYFNKQLDIYSKLFAVNVTQQALFCIWLTCNVAKIQNYNEYGEHIDCKSNRITTNVNILTNAFKKILSDCNAEECLYRSLVLSAPFLSKFWILDVTLEIYQQFWEYYWKKMNSDLLCKYPNSIKGIVKYVIDTSSNFNVNSAKSYELFLYLLCNHFKHFSDISLWNRLKGRIYSRLSPNTINELNDRQMFNLMFLFLCVSNILPIETDISERMVSILSDLSPAKQQSALILHIYAAFIIVSNKKGFSLSQNLQKLVDNLLNILTIVSSDRSNGKLIRSFVEGIYECSSTKDFEHLFLGHWINYYTNWCSRSDLSYFLDVILKLCHKKWADGGILWEEHCKTLILPCLKSVAITDLNAACELGKIAAIILAKHPESLPEYFPFFAGDRSSPKMMLQFLVCLLNNSDFRLCHTDEKLLYKVVQAWIKGCMIFNDDRMAALNRNIVQLPVMEIIREQFQEMEHHNSSSDTFLVFVKALEVEINRKPEKLGSLRNWCETIFSHLPAWINTYVKTCECVDVKIVNMYTCGGYLVYHCPLILYSKAKTNCILTVLIGTLLLPTDILTGKKPRKEVLDALKVNLHLYIKGIAKLNYQQDPYLERAMHDMITKYVPYFNDYESPFLKCLDQQLGPFIMDKLSLLLKQLKNDPDNLERTLNFVCQIVNVNNRNVSVEHLQMVVTKLFPVLFDLLLAKEQINANKKLIVTILKNIASVSEFSKVTNDVTNFFIRFTENYLAFNSGPYFLVMSSLAAEIMPREVHMALPFLRNQITNIEKIRGVGNANNLKTGLKKVEDAVANALKK